MAIGTYAELQAAVANWLARGDLASGGSNVARVPEIVALAESQINADIRVQTMAGTTIVAMTIGNKATIWDTATKVIRSVKIITFDPPHELAYMSPERMVDVQETGYGEPEFYTLRDALEWNVLPSQAYSVQIDHYTRLNIAATSTNWLLTALPNLYLYCCLYHACVLSDNDQGAVKWKGMYDDFLPRAQNLMIAISGGQDAQAVFDVPYMGDDSYNVMTD